MSAEIKPISGVDDRVSLAEKVPLDTPFTMNVFPTNACNFRCNYCAQSLGREVLRERYQFDYDSMSMETFEVALEQMQEFSRPFKLLSFMGHGEPLLHRKLPDMIRMVRDSGVAERIEIITNGAQLNHELSEKLVASGLSTLRVSLQGLSSKKYREISNVRVDFDRFLEELRYFYKIRKKTKLFVKIVDASLDMGEEQTFYDVFQDMSDRMFVEHIKPVYDGVTYGNSEKDLTSDRYGNYHEKRMVCPMPFYVLALWPNGDVVPCDAIYKPLILGNVRKKSLVEMWKGEALISFWKMQLEKKREGYPGCGMCCAPDDVSHPMDVLDNSRESIKERLKKSI